MDPDANLAEQRVIVKRLRTCEAYEIEDLAMRLADLAEALDKWITDGGFLPHPWRY